MLFTLKMPLSHRFAVLSFEGFIPKGKGKIKYRFWVITRFFKALLKYFSKRLALSVKTFIKGIFLTVRLLRWAKGYLVKKLISSRGRLGRNFINFGVMSAAFVVFLFGEILSGSQLVNSQQVSQDFLQVESDIIPEKNTSLTLLPEARQRQNPIAYKISSGDTLSTIGQKFKISVDALKYVNGFSDNEVLKVDQEIIIPPMAGIVHKVVSGENIESIASKYQVAAQSIADFNYIINPSKIAVGTELIIPDAKIPQAPVYTPIVPAVINEQGAIDKGAKKGWCMWPTSTRIVSQDFWWGHNGVDIAASWGGAMPPIYACSSGIVTRAGWDPWGLGLHIRINHGNGYETVYGHMSKLNVSVNDKVQKGQTIGILGSTGRSTGPHIHFMVMYKGVAQNPLNYIN